MLGFHKKDNDPLHNRRRLMVLSALYFVIWGFVILLCSIKYDLETGKVVAFLSYITTISGTGVGAYLFAAQKNGFPKPGEKKDDSRPPE